MKLNNQIPFTNLSLISIILISFFLGKCTAHNLKDVFSNIGKGSSPTPEPSQMDQAYAPEPSQEDVTYAPEPSQEDLTYAPEPSQDDLTYAPKSSVEDLTYASEPSQEDEDNASKPRLEDDVQFNRAYAPESSQFSNSEAPISFSPSDAPGPASDENSGISSSFSDAFSDILKGSLHDPSIIAPQPANPENKPKNPELEKICGHTDYPDVCLATVSPLLDDKFDVVNVLEAAIKACTLQTKFTIDKVAKHAAESPELDAELSNCKDKYNNALESLKKAMDCIPSRDFGTITVTLGAVMADVSSCESSFEDLKSPSAKSNIDGLVSITVSNCISIASLIPN